MRHRAATKEVQLTDEHVQPRLDAEGRILLDERRHPIFQLKPNVTVDEFFWKRYSVADKDAYRWFRATIYEGKTIPEIWRPAWLGALLVLIGGTTVLTGLYIFAQRRYLKGEPIRGTRELSPRAYGREHRKHTGYGITVYEQGRTR